MSWKTHTEGGSWSGGGTEVPNCNLGQRDAITAGFTFMQSNAVPRVDSAGGKAVDLANCLRGKTVDSVEIDCCGSSCGSDCDDNFGTASGNSINMCAPALPPAPQADTDVTIFHELIHTCGGREIDSWSMENHFYSGHGTFDPSSSVVDGFRSETSDVGDGLRAATFVVWEPAAGRVFVKVESGGSWNSGPTVSRGTELAVNRAAYMRP